MIRLLPCALLIVGCANPGVRSSARIQTEMNMKYGSALSGDFYEPPRTGTLRPAVVVVHGGGWARRSGDMSSLCRRLAREGFVVLNATYRLAPGHHFPDPVADVREAIMFLRTEAARLQIDPRRISAWGYSAGANLVLLAGLDGRSGLNAIVAGGTPADLTVWPDSDMVRNFIGEAYDKAPEKWRDASPVNHVTADSPPVFLYHGSWDRIVEPAQMERMAQALRARSRVVETFEVPYLGHLAVYFWSRESVDRGIRFLRAQMGSSN